jgi:hypothetical protein
MLVGREPGARWMEAASFDKLRMLLGESEE